MLALILRDGWSRFALVTSGVLAAGLIVETYFFIHYAAPITGLVFVLILQTMRQLRLWRWRSWHAGRLVVWTILLICLTSFAVAFAQQVRTSRSSEMPPRARILAQLKQTNGRHLVIVRYGRAHLTNEEWVYNDADIDGAKVVWAREMDSTQNKKLLEYFNGRQVWLVELDRDDHGPRMTRYPTA